MKASARTVTSTSAEQFHLLEHFALTALITFVVIMLFYIIPTL